MLREFYDWWLTQLVAWTPLILMPRDGRQEREVTLIAPEQDNGSTEQISQLIEVLVEEDHHERTIGKYLIDDIFGILTNTMLDPPGNFTLALADTMFVERRIELPLTGERYASQIVRNQMDLETPFSADEVYWHVDQLYRDLKAGKAIFRLALAPRQQVDPLLRQLNSNGLHIADLISAGNRKGARIPLARSNAEFHRVKDRVQLLRATCGALALACIGIPYLYQINTVSQMERRIAALQRQVDGVQRIRQLLSKDARLGTVIAAERRHLGDPIETLYELTQTLPDDSYVTGLRFHRHLLVVDGVSRRSTGALQAMIANPVFASADFSGPITRTPDASAELFKIAATIPQQQ